MATEASSLKTKVDTDEVKMLLFELYALKFIELVAIPHGESSQAYFFTANHTSYVIRVHTEKQGFEKDNYAFSHFSSKDIPIPQIEKIGQLTDSLFYAISKRVAGNILDTFDQNTVSGLLPTIIQVLEAIHRVDISQTKNYGPWNLTGNAEYKTWREYIVSINPTDSEWWQDIFNTTCMEEETAQKLFTKITELVDMCSEKRVLLHCDFGFNNVLSDGKDITGVVDWELSMYGDFVYDIAWLGLWSDEIDYVEYFAKYYKKHGVSISHFKERVLCYKLFQGLGALSFYARSDQENNYKWLQDKLLLLLKTS